MVGCYSYRSIALSKSRCCWVETRVLAVIQPLAATAGRPIPGKVESPQQSSQQRGFWGTGEKPLSGGDGGAIGAAMATEKAFMGKGRAHQGDFGAATHIGNHPL
jgi:hypothetical protein